MDAHFDFDQFHPTFLNDGVGAAGDNFFHWSMDSFLETAHEHGLSDDVIRSSLADAYHFFGLASESFQMGDFTCVSYNDPTVWEDDVLTIGREELLSHGVHDKSTASLICTHEIAHRLTQMKYAYGEITTWQSELIADKWMGFRAAVEGMDINKILCTFEGLTDEPLHPGQDLRSRHVIEAYETLRDLIDRGERPDYDSLMNLASQQINNDPDIALREMETNRVFNTNVHNSASSYANYTKSEIDSHIRNAQDNIEHAKGVISRKSDEMASRAAKGLPVDECKASIGRARIDLDNARKDLSHWQSEKPVDKKNRV